MESPLRTSALSTWLLDPVAPTAEATGEPAFRFSGTSRSWLLPLAFGVALLALSVVGGTVDAKQFYFSYLVGWAFCLTISLGALFFVMVHHIVRAHWMVVVRRVAETMAMSIPVLGLLFIPIAFGMHDLFHWTHADLYVVGGPHYDPILAGKQVFLNTPFFFARVVLYFVAWSLLATRLYRLSLRQDIDPDHDIPAKQRWWSALGIPVYAITLSFAAFDLVMSVDPHWFSTIFGVYIFAGAYWVSFAFIVLVTILLQRGGALGEAVGDGHYLDLGKWMFAFTIFWAYIAFSQYMLIWYGNLKEETIWFSHRMEHGWEYHSAALLIAHFILPFFILLSQTAKKSTALLSIMAVWIFVMQWFDLHWLIQPVRVTEMIAAGEQASTFHWLDLTTWLGLFGIFAGLFFYRLARHPLVPINDPRLARSIAHGHV